MKKAYFARLDKGKSSDVDTEVSKPMSKLTVRKHNKSVFVSTCHLCGVVDHIRPNCSLLRQELLGILMFDLTVINRNLCNMCFSLGYVMINLLSKVL